MKKEKDYKYNPLIPTGIMKQPDERDMNIPISILSGIFEDQHNTFQKIVMFCLYQHAIGQLLFLITFEL